MYVAIALAVSVGANLFQWRAAIIDVEQDHYEKQIIERDAIIEAHRSLIAKQSLIAELKVYDDALLIDQLWKMSERSRERVLVYRDRVQQLPPLSCAPGQERVDATNEVLSKP